MQEREAHLTVCIHIRDLRGILGSIRAENMDSLDACIAAVIAVQAQYEVRSPFIGNLGTLEHSDELILRFARHKHFRAFRQQHIAQFHGDLKHHDRLAAAGYHALGHSDSCRGRLVHVRSQLHRLHLGLCLVSGIDAHLDALEPSFRRLFRDRREVRRHLELPAVQCGGRRGRHHDRDLVIRIGVGHGDHALIPVILTRIDRDRMRFLRALAFDHHCIASRGGEAIVYSVQLGCNDSFARAACRTSLIAQSGNRAFALWYNRYCILFEQYLAAQRINDNIQLDSLVCSGKLAHGFEVPVLPVDHELAIVRSRFIRHIYRFAVSQIKGQQRTVRLYFDRQALAVCRCEDGQQQYQTQQQNTDLFHAQNPDFHEC